MSVELPTAGTTKQFVPDIDGGWMYVIVTTVSIEQHTLQSVQQQLNEARQAVIDAQARVDELEPQAISFETAISAKPISLIQPVAATSTPMK